MKKKQPASPLLYAEGLTQDEVGEVLSLERRAVSIIERKAIEKARKKLAERGINADDLLGD
jgi:transcriptional regulator